MNCKNIMTCFFTFFVAYEVDAQSHSHSRNKALTYPNIEDYLTLKTDFHQHTVFSDGNVWPTIRVHEALRENLDAISLTEHLEYQPHKEDIPHPDRNRSYNLALEEAKEHGLLIVKGSEITRAKPIGHCNAIFTTDDNKLLSKEDPKVPFREAKNQGAFVFWNHPFTDKLPDFLKARVESNEIQGIEVINGRKYNEESLALALKHNLTIMGTSDIHGLIAWDYIEKDINRPITLVFAKERSLESMKEALVNGRTVAVLNSILVGKPEFLNPLLQSSIIVKKTSYRSESSILDLELENISSSDLLLENQMAYSFHNGFPKVFELPARETVEISINTVDKMEQIQLRLKALGAYTAPKENPIIEWEIRPTGPHPF